MSGVNVFLPGPFLPQPADSTIAEDILVRTSQMRRDGSFEEASLCWSADQLERLAMFAIGAKYELKRLRAAGGAT